jgi:hypothetical protein
MGPRLTVGPWWTRDHGATRLFWGSGGHHDSSERERERGGRRGLTPMAPLGSRAVEMVKQRCSTKAADGATMARWFRVRGGEIGTGVGAVDNGGTLVVPFTRS